MWIRWQSAVDFVVLAWALYLVLMWARETRAMRIALAILGMHALARLAQQFLLPITSWVLDGASLVFVGIMLMLFQPELRRALLRLDTLMQFRPQLFPATDASVLAIARAAFSLAAAKIGALIILTRNDSVRDLADGGVTLSSDVSPELLETIFLHNSPLHDGAVVVENGRLLRAGAILPLTQRQDVPGFYGTRHRAAMGLAERCDAIVVAVSEERGEVTLIERDHRTRMPDEQKLLETLRRLRLGPRTSLSSRLKRLVTRNLNLKLAAIGAAALVWATSVAVTGSRLTVITAPVEFSNVPRNLHIVRQSSNEVEVELRGSPWAMSGFDPQQVTVRCDLRGRGAGFQSIPLVTDDVAAPAGVTVERVSPSRISLVLQK